MNGNSNSSSSNVQNIPDNNIASCTTEYIESLYARRNQDWDSFFEDESNIDNMKNRMEVENDINASEYNDDNTPMISLNNSTSDLNLSSKPNEAQHSDDTVNDELDESNVLKRNILGGIVADKSMDDSSLSYISRFDLVNDPKPITSVYNDDDTPIVSLNSSTSDLNIASPKPIMLESHCDDDMLDDDSMSHSSRLHHHHHIVENKHSNELKRNIIDDYNVMENSIGVSDEIIDDEDDEDEIVIDKKSVIDPKMNMYLGTPVEQNVIVSSVMQPKTSDEYRLVCDGITDDDYDETAHIKHQPMQQPKREGVLVFNRSSSNLDVSSLSLHSNNSMIDENQNSNHSSNNGNMVDCNKIIDGGDVVVIGGMNEDIDDLNYDENDVQSMDAIERRDYEQEQKLTGGVIVRNCSLINNERLNLDIINSLKNEDTLGKSGNDEDKKSLHPNTITSTPTSSRNSTIRTTKSAVKLNLSASLDRVAASSNSNQDIKTESDTSIISSSKKLDLISKINYKLNPGVVSAIATTSSALSSSSSSTSVVAAKSSIIRNPAASLVDGNCFMNTNSNDSLSSDEGVKDSISNLNNSSSSNSNQTVKNHHPIIADCSTASSSASSILNNNNASTSSSKIVTNKIICSASTSSSSSPNCQFSGHHCCADNLDDNDDVEIINNDDDNIEPRVVSSPNRKFGDYFGETNEFGSLTASSSRRSSKVQKSIVERNIDEFEHNLQHHHHHHLDAPQMIISVSERDHDFEEDTWADCEEGFDIEEVCTCKNYADEDERTGCDSEDELPSKDVDLSGFTNIDSTLPEDIMHDPNTNDNTVRIHRKRKLTGVVGSETTPGGRKRLALHNNNSSPRKGTITNTPTTLSCSSPLFPSPILSERRTPRLLIPTKDNPPPELNEWLIQFQKWSPAERILAIDRLIESCDPTQVRHMMKVIEPQFQRDFISLLPKEVALQVLSFLEPCDLLRAAQTCRSWRFLCDDNLLWKEKCKQVSIVMEASQDRPKRGRAGNMPPISSEWKAAYMRQHIIEMNWRSRPIREPKILKGHDDHVITCLQFCGNRIVSGSDDNTLKVWSAVTGKCLRTLVGHTGGVWSSQMAGNIIISGSTDRTLKVWNAEGGQCIHTLYGHTSTVRCMHLHENKVVSGSRDATLRVWDINTGACLHVLVGHLAAVRCVQYDGRLVVSGAYDYMVKVWNPEKQECLHTLQGHTNRVYSLQFDGIHVVSGSLDTSIRVWDAETGSCKHTLMGHQSLTSGMELRQNILVSGNADSTVKVWDIITGQCLQTLSGSNKHQSAVTCLQFNSRFVITSSDDGTVKLWDVKTGEFIRNLVALDSGGSGGVVWRIRANDTKLVCAVGSRNGTEETKLMVLDFDVEGACLKCS